MTFTCRKIFFLTTLWVWFSQIHIDYAGILWCRVSTKTDLIRADISLWNLPRKGMKDKDLNYSSRLLDCIPISEGLNNIRLYISRSNYWCAIKTGSEIV